MDLKFPKKNAGSKAAEEGSSSVDQHKESDDDKDKFEDAEEVDGSRERLIEDMDDDEFFALFNGLHLISGSGQAYNAAFDFLSGLNGRRFVRAVETCLIIHEKPKILMMTGRTKSGKDVGKRLSIKLVKVMPMLSEEQIKERDESTKEADIRGRKARMSYAPEWRNVNFSCVRRIALMAIEFKVLSYKKSSVISTIYQKYPQGITTTDWTLDNCKGNDLTLKSRMESKDELVRNKVHWSKLAWRDMFETNYG